MDFVRKCWKLPNEWPKKEIYDLRLTAQIFPLSGDDVFFSKGRSNSDPQRPIEVEQTAMSLRRIALNLYIDHPKSKDQPSSTTTTSSTTRIALRRGNSGASILSGSVLLLELLVEMFLSESLLVLLPDDDSHNHKSDNHNRHDHDRDNLDIIQAR